MKIKNIVSRTLAASLMAASVLAGIGATEAGATLPTYGLSNLTFSAGTLSSSTGATSFSESATTYYLTVPAGTTSLTYTPTLDATQASTCTNAAASTFTGAYIIGNLGNPVTLTSGSPTTVSLYGANAAGISGLQVSTPTAVGCNSTFYFIHIYEAAPAGSPQAASPFASPSMNISSSGGNVTVTGSNLNTVTSVSLSWITNCSGTCTQNTQSVTPTAQSATSLTFAVPNTTSVNAFYASLVSTSPAFTYYLDTIFVRSSLAGNFYGIGTMNQSLSVGSGPGAGGGSLTLYGRFYGLTPTIQFGTTAAANVSVTPGTDWYTSPTGSWDTVVVTVPAGTGTVNVAASTSAGAALSPTYTYTYTSGQQQQQAPAAIVTTPVTNVTAVMNNGVATVSWGFPASNGGAAISGYTVTASPGGATCTTTNNGCNIDGLNPGTSYTFSVVANNSAGKSAAAVSNAVSYTAPVATPPAGVLVGHFYLTGNAPGVVPFTGVAMGKGAADLWINGLTNNGGVAIDSFQYSVNGGAWTTINPSATGDFIIKGLMKGAASIRLRAVNAIGTGVASPAHVIVIK